MAELFMIINLFMVSFIIGPNYRKLMSRKRKYCLLRLWFNKFIQMHPQLVSWNLYVVVKQLCQFLQEGRRKEDTALDEVFPKLSCFLIWTPDIRRCPEATPAHRGYFQSVGFSVVQVFFTYEMKKFTYDTSETHSIIIFLALYFVLNSNSQDGQQNT